MKTVALVLGGAPSVWDELKAAKRLVRGRPHIIVAANHAGRLYDGHLDAWATLHPEKFRDWREDREEDGHNTDYRAFIHANRRALDNVEVVPQTWSASSGVYAAQIALEALGCSGAILCGVPMDPEAGHIIDEGEWALFERYRPGVLEAAKVEAPIRAMSGWTAEVLGAPTKAWLEEIGVGRGRLPRRRKPKEKTMRVQMIRTRNYTPRDDRRVTTKFRQAGEYTVKRSWGDEMVKDGDAVEIDPPARGSDADAG